MGVLQTPTDVKQQMDLSLDIIVSGSQFAHMSAHFYNSAAIRQLQRWTIERDCALTLAEKEIRGLHSRTSHHSGQLVVDCDSLRAEQDSIRIERDSLRTDFDSISEVLHLLKIIHSDLQRERIHFCLTSSMLNGSRPALSPW